MLPETFSATLFYSWLQEWEVCTFTICVLTFKRNGCARTFWNVVFKLCDDQNLKFEPKTINLHFELGMVNLLREEFREVEFKGCRFHLGQAWYRKIQSLGLAQDYKDKYSEIGKWLSQ